MPGMAQQDEDHSSFSIGYINKDWVTDFPDGAYHENIFGEEGKRLHGLQIAYNYTNCLPVGLGIHTGIAYEWCMSYSEKVKDMGFGRFNEHSLYLPIHATWRLPIGRDVRIYPFAGFGFNWKMAANLKSGLYDGMWTASWDTYHRWGSPFSEISLVRYGKNGWPHALNAQAEFGVNLHVNKYVLGFTYSLGLTDHGFYRNEMRKTRQNKIAITLGTTVF